MSEIRLLGGASQRNPCDFKNTPFCCGNAADMGFGPELRPKVCESCLMTLVLAALDPKAQDLILAAVAVVPAREAPDEDAPLPVGEEGDDDEPEEVDEASIYAAAVAELADEAAIHAPPPSAGRRVELLVFRERITKGEAKAERFCEAAECHKPIPADWPAVYCTNACALGDA
jgi:hypothetical protein